MGWPQLDNEAIAAALERVARLFEVQGGEVRQVTAYRDAALVVRSLVVPVGQVLDQEGPSSLEKLPGISRTVSASIRELARTGQLTLLSRLEGQICPEEAFQTLPGIGGHFARVIHRELKIDTLEELNEAAHDGRLEKLPGFGPRRTTLVREMLDKRLGEKRNRLQRGEDAEEVPSVELLLSIDAEYRERVKTGTLRKIAPRKFNPTRARWLPVLHGDKAGWSFTAMFSNTARAHELGRTDDWVLVFFEKDGFEEQATVVTEYDGPLAGKRVVRGRESECRALYHAELMRPAVQEELFAEAATVH